MHRSGYLVSPTIHDPYPYPHQALVLMLQIRITGRIPIADWPQSLGPDDRLLPRGVGEEAHLRPSVGLCIVLGPHFPRDGHRLFTALARCLLTSFSVLSNSEPRQRSPIFAGMSRVARLVPSERWVGNGEDIDGAKVESRERRGLFDGREGPKRNGCDCSGAIP